MESRQVRRHSEREALKGPHRPPFRGVLGFGRTGHLQFPAEPDTYSRRDAEARAALKGRFDGNCNRTACQEPIAGNNWWNIGTRAYYCQRCAYLINEWPAQRGEALICFAVQEPQQ